MTNLIWLIDGLGYGGAERLALAYLPYLRQESFQIRVCAFQVKQGNPIASQLQALGIAVDLLPIAHLRDATALPRLYRYLGHHSAQLVHTQLEFANTLGTMAGRLRHLPTISTLHTIEPLDQPGKSGRRLRLMWWVLQRGCRRFIAVSDQLRRHYLAHFPQLAARFVTLYNGIEVNRFAPRPEHTPQPLRQSYGLPPTAPIILTVAVLREPKGLQYMIAAMPQIVQAIPEARYVVVGNGPHEAALRQLAHQSGLGDHIVFAGAQDNIPDWLAMSDLFVLPTLADALPTVLMEAMAAGRPILASAVGGVPEMVTDGQNGLLLRPGQPQALAQAAIHLLQNPALAHQMGQRGQQTALNRFNLANQAHALAEIYREVASGK